MRKIRIPEILYIVAYQLQKKTVYSKNSIPIKWIYALFVAPQTGIYFLNKCFNYGYRSLLFNTPYCLGFGATRTVFQFY